MGLAAVATAIHLLGYAIYVQDIRRGRIEANPLSWLMFAYGTALLAVLEFRFGASPAELFLPTPCAGASIVVAALCVRPNRFHSIGLGDVAVFSFDVILTAIYVAVWWSVERGTLAGDILPQATILSLICVNLGTIASFAPLVRSARANPRTERPTPWLLWSVAYGLLLAVTILEYRGLQDAALLIYPALNVLTHGTIGITALVGALRKELREPFETKLTQFTGLGVFTKRTYARGNHVFVLEGVVRRYHSRNVTEALAHENWFGIGKDLWIDPDTPFNFLNHSCEPNLGQSGQRDFVALRDIAAGEELTLDYSITEDELHWSMACECRTQKCRKVILPIQFLPPEAFEAYMPHINPYFQRVFRRYAKSPSSRTRGA